MLQFDPVEHRYSFNGVALPSVTQILQQPGEFDFVPPEMLERARQFGSHCHKAVDLYCRGRLNEQLLDPALRPRLFQFKRFLAETGFVVLDTEQRVLALDLGYAGTRDILGKFPRSSLLWLLDLKSGAVPRSVGPQTAAYAYASQERPPMRGYLQLRDDDYRFRSLHDPLDFSRFCAALTNYRKRISTSEHKETGRNTA